MDADIPISDLAPIPARWRRLIPFVLRDLIWGGENTRYDAFLSYRWKADTRLAPFIQSVLQRFLCPWFRRRSLRIFRDLSSLPAGSDLRAELCKRLDNSTHLIVLANPAAKESPGMEFEVSYWLSKRREGEIIVILTSGNFETWDEISRCAIPPSLAKGLRSEPLWIDISQFREAILKDPSDPEVRGQLVEKLCQVILRFHPKRDWGELRGEERAQRVRALGLLSAFTGLLLSLSLAAIWFAIQANNQRYAAETANGIAQERRQVALGQQLAAQSELLRNESGDAIQLSGLLAIEAQRRTQTFEAHHALSEVCSLLARFVQTIVDLTSNRLATVAISPDGKLIATDDKKLVRILDALTGTELAVSPVDFRDASLLAVSNGGASLAAEVHSGQIMVWNRKSRKIIESAPRKDRLFRLAFTSDGKQLMTLSKAEVTLLDASSLTVVRSWEAPSAAEVFTEVAVNSADDLFGILAEKEEIRKEMLSFRGDYSRAPWAVAIGAKGQLLITLEVLQPLREWRLTVVEAATGRATASLPLSAAPVVTSLSQDGNLLAFADGSGLVRVIEIPSRREISRITQTEPLESIFFVESSYRILTLSEKGALRSWDIFGGNHFGPDLGDANGTQFFGIDWPKSQIVAVNDFGGVHNFDGSTGAVRSIRSDGNGPGTVAVSSDGHLVAIVEYGAEKTVILWDSFAGKKIAQISQPTKVLHLSFSPDSSILAVGSTDGVRLWSTLADHRNIDFIPHDGESSAVGFDPTGHYLLYSTYHGFTTIKDLTTGRSIGSHEHVGKDSSWVVGSYSFSRNGTRVALIGGNVEVFELPSFRRLCLIEEAPIKNNDSEGPQTLLSPDGEVLVTSTESLVRLWHASTGRPTDVVIRHTKNVHVLAFSPDSRFLATGAADGTTLISDLGGNRLEQFSDRGDITTLIFSPDGHLVLTGEFNGPTRLRYWQFNDLSRQTCSRLFRYSLTPDEWKNYLNGEPFHVTCPTSATRWP